MSHAKLQLKELIREGVRSTIHNTLSPVIQEVTEEELRTALREPAFKDPLMEGFGGNSSARLRSCGRTDGHDHLAEGDFSANDLLTPLCFPLTHTLSPKGRGKENDLSPARSGGKEIDPSPTFRERGLG